MTELEAALCAVIILLAAGLILSNWFWLKHLRYLTNIAVSRNPSEFVTMQHGSMDKRVAVDRKPRPRPDGI